MSAEEDEEAFGCDRKPGNAEGDDFLLVERTEFLNVILREWFHHLTTLEKVAVLFIFDRTWGWQKYWEKITLDQFTGGVFGYIPEKGPKPIIGKFRPYAAPVTKDRTRASKLIKGLVEKGVVKKRRLLGDRRGFYEYSLNEDWDYPKIKVPKKVIETHPAFLRDYRAVKDEKDKQSRRNARKRARRSRGEN